MYAPNFILMPEGHRVLRRPSCMEEFDRVDTSRCEPRFAMCVKSPLYYLVSHGYQNSFAAMLEPATVKCSL